MFERNSSGDSNGGSSSPILLPTKTEYFVHREDKYGGDIIIKAHGLGAGRGGVLVASELKVEKNAETGEPFLVQRNTQMFRYWNDVEIIDMPAVKGAIN